MRNAQTMRAKDAIRGSAAECFVTIEKKRYNFMSLISFEAKIEKEKTEIAILGRTMKGNKASGSKGTWEAKGHYNNSIMREVLKRFKDTGEDLYFEIQVTNDDPTSAAGRQTTVLLDCNLDGGIIAKFDAEAEYLEDEFSGTFDDYEMPETFKLLDGMM